jgi:hypothetical protein
MEMGMLIITQAKAFSYTRESSAVMRVEFISDRMLHITLRDGRCDIILNVHSPTEDKSDDTKDNLYEEIEHVFDQFPKYHIHFF